MRVTSLRIVGNFGLFLCIALSVNVLSVKCAVIQFQSRNVTASEGDGSINVNICINPQVAVDFDIAFSLTILSRTPVDDITVPPTGIIRSGNTCGTITIGITDDTVEEDTEAFNVLLTSDTSDATTDSTLNVLTVNVEDNDVPMIGFDTTTVAVPEDVGMTTVQVCFLNSVTLSNLVSFSLSTSPASPNNYLVPSSGNIFAGSNCATITITVIDDNLVEPAGHQFTISIIAVTTTNAAVDSSSSSFIVFINDNDAGIGFTTSSSSVFEDVGTITPHICFKNVVSLSTDVEFNLFTSSTSSNNYLVPPSGNISAGSGCATITITVIDDNLVEPAGHQFTITITAVTTMNAAVDSSSSSFSVVINDNDSVIGFTTPSSSVLEDVGTITPRICFKNVVSLSTDVEFSLFTSSTSSNNYLVPLSGNILAGSDCTSINITVIDDNLVEPAGHQFTITITAVTTRNAAVDSSSSSFSVVINDNDADCNQQIGFCQNGGQCTQSTGICSCPTEYTGATCSIDVDECLTNMGGCDQISTTCQNTDGSFICLCKEGFVNAGQQNRCTENPCTSNPCQGGGTCNPIAQTTGILTYMCDCPQGRTGVNCENAAGDVCVNNPCQGGGTCTIVSGRNQCTCPPGRTGFFCETLTENPCTSNPCQGGGTCNPIAQTTGILTYMCDCPQGRTGVNCENAAGDVCVNNPCQGGGTCTIVSGRNQCTCPPGRTGFFCETLTKNPCTSNPCQGGGTCNPIAQTTGILTYMCDCPQGRTGVNCENAAGDVCVNNPCQGGGTCTIVSGRNQCTCPPGRTGFFCETLTKLSTVPSTAPTTPDLSTVPSTTPTTPALNCNNDSTACGENATCKDLPPPNGIYCSCKKGFSPGGFLPPMPSNCFDTNECNTSNDCVNQAACRNTVGSYNCTCPDGYYESGLNASGRLECRACDRTGVDHMYGFNCSQLCTCATGAVCAGDTGICTGSCADEPNLTCDKNDVNVTLTTLLSSEVAEGKIIVVKCSVNLMSVDVRLSWTGPNGVITAGGRYLIYPDSAVPNGEVLQVSQANPEDTGIYNCTATLIESTDDVTSVTGSVLITVLVQGKIVSELPGKKKGVSGSNLTLTCVAFGNPMPSVQWLFMNQSADDSFTNVNEIFSEDTVAFKSTANLTFHNLSKANNGIYTCQVKVDSDETNSAAVTLIVVDLPEITSLQVLMKTSVSLFLTWTIADNGSDTLTCRANYTEQESPDVNVVPCSSNTSCSLTGLSPYTQYNVIVECRNAAGYGEPLSISEITDSSEPSAPQNPAVENNRDNCVIRWDESESANGPDLSYEVTWDIRHAITDDPDDSEMQPVSTTSTQYQLTKKEMELNSKYTFKICARNRDHRGGCVNAAEPCTTNPGAPEEIPSIETPDPETAVNSSSVTLTVPQVDDRNGPISCYEFVVVKRTAEQSGDGSPDDDLPFEKVQNTPENDIPYRSVVMNHGEYIKRDTVTIGSDGTVTTCMLAGNSNRRKRRSNIVNGNQELVATNPPLSRDTQYDIFMRTYTPTDDGMFQYVSSDYVSVTTDSVDVGRGGARSGLIAFLVLLILAIIIAGAILFVWKKRNAKEKLDTETVPMQQSINGGHKNVEGIDNPGYGGADGHHDGKNRGFEDDDMIAEVSPINIDQLGESILEKHKQNDKLFFSEFRSLMSTNPQATIENFNNVANKEKNRYINIPCYDHSRVKLNILEGVENSDYINANYVDGYSVPDKFIAAQGPKEETVEDFWRMVWEQNTKTIIMLTRCFESGRDKCFPYWPDSGDVTYGKFTVCLDSTLECPDYVIRQFRLSMGGDEESDEEAENRTVMQFHFLAWPDHGVPEYPYTMLAFVKRIRQMTQNKPEKGQNVIHCSAGVGRTGTYITIDAMLDRLKEEKTVDIFNFIQKIRLQRSTLVQSQVQYVFIYHALHEEHLYGHTEVRLNDLQQYFRRLKIKAVQDDLSPLHNEFKTAATLPVKDTSTKEASKAGNKEKNRIRNYLPYDKNRVSLERLVGDENSTYINASYINGYERRNMYIITQAPMENTASDFWRMVWDSLSSTVVMLTDLEEKGNEMCVKFWPEEEPKTFGNLTVELASEEEEEDFTIKDFTMSNNQGVSGRKVRMYQFHGWPEIGVPDCESVTHLVTVSHEYQKGAEEDESADQSKHPIIVFCHTGVGRTAIWCALSILIERAKAEGVVDVFQTVRTLRQQRQHMVQDHTQYEFLYKAVMSHLGKFDADTYENVPCQ